LSAEREYLFLRELQPGIRARHFTLVTLSRDGRVAPIRWSQPHFPITGDLPA